MITLEPAAANTMISRGFAFLHAPESRRWLEEFGRLGDWNKFTASWDAMQRDTYMRDGGRYRRRRHAIFATRPGEPVRRCAHAPHFQTLDYNNLNGGIRRWFEPMPPAIGASETLGTILRATRSLFDDLRPGTSWHVELHQFRIEAQLGEAGQPTPEGMHRDGVDYVLVLLIGRRNIASGTTTIHDLGGRTLGSFTLTVPLDAALVDDCRVFHGVTPVEPLVAGAPAFRDVLVVTYRAR
ncbi:MAG TPA: 2OG-Fe dioxygenase family protein [Acetobacteraceae bacterium]|jgi:hypothetical protein|nr:2OG-Fe dioxygenase family protein [Acetobacteraceae bacterium]